jgi:hypothetical protein
VADSGIKKIEIMQIDLPAIRNTEEYLLRYRVRTADNSSNWSKVYVVGKSAQNTISSLVAQEPVVPSISQIDNNGKFKISWTMPNSINLNYFDVYLKWYYTTTQPDENTQNATAWTVLPNVVYLPSIDIAIPPNAKWMQIAVTAETFPKFVEKTSLDTETTFLFKTELRRAEQTLDGGNPGGGNGVGGNVGGTG